MIQVINPEDCCGCTACASICAHDAINMEPDPLGFLYPKVDESKCVECGLCEKVCQFNDNYDRSLNLKEPIAYASRHKDIDEVMKSRSGAAFVAISDYILEQRGIVYGAGYKDHFRVAHKRATTKEERDEFRGSKYVQSDLIDVFRQVKEDLKNGLTVLFSGTPCQTSGLNSYVGKRLRENLILVDIVCHGVPGPFLWRDNIAYHEKRRGDQIVSVNFRDKELFGWKAHQETYLFKRGEKVISKYLFYQTITFRNSCAVCHFANLHRPSDLTIADFWGWENVVPDMNLDDKGINLVLLNTEKGKVIFEKASCQMNVREVDIMDCVQQNLKRPTRLPSNRKAFEDYYLIHGYYETMKHYGYLIRWKSIYVKIKRLIMKLNFIKNYI